MAFLVQSVKAQHASLVDKASADFNALRSHIESTLRDQLTWVRAEITSSVASRQSAPHEESGGGLDAFRADLEATLAAQLEQARHELGELVQTQLDDAARTQKDPEVVAQRVATATLAALGPELDAEAARLAALEQEARWGLGDLGERVSRIESTQSELDLDPRLARLREELVALVDQVRVAAQEAADARRSEVSAEVAGLAARVAAVERDVADGLARLRESMDAGRLELRAEAVNVTTASVGALSGELRDQQNRLSGVADELAQLASAATTVKAANDTLAGRLGALDRRLAQSETANRERVEGLRRELDEALRAPRDLALTVDDLAALRESLQSAVAARTADVEAETLRAAQAAVEGRVEMIAREVSERDQAASTEIERLSRALDGLAPQVADLATQAAGAASGAALSESSEAGTRRIAALEAQLAEHVAAVSGSLESHRAELAGKGDLAALREDLEALLNRSSQLSEGDSAAPSVTDLEAVKAELDAIRGLVTDLQARTEAAPVVGPARPRATRLAAKKPAVGSARRGAVVNPAPAVETTPAKAKAATRKGGATLATRAVAADTPETRKPRPTKRTADVPDAPETRKTAVKKSTTASVAAAAKPSTRKAAATAPAPRKAVVKKSAVAKAPTTSTPARKAALKKSSPPAAAAGIPAKRRAAVTPQPTRSIPAAKVSAAPRTPARRSTAATAQPTAAAQDVVGRATDAAERALRREQARARLADRPGSAHQRSLLATPARKPAPAAAPAPVPAPTPAPAEEAAPARQAQPVLRIRAARDASAPAAPPPRAPAPPASASPPTGSPRFPLAAAAPMEDQRRAPEPTKQAPRPLPPEPSSGTVLYDVEGLEREEPEEPARPRGLLGRLTGSRSRATRR